jgi:uncharacterized protein YabE (DUF348 family)
VQGIVLLALIAGVGAYTTFDKAITLSVDGQTRQVHTFAATVGDLLAAQDVHTGQHDLVAPSPGSSLVDNTVVAVRFGHQIALDVNGQTRHVWVTGLTVGQALAELGVRTQGAVITPAQTTPITASGMAITAWTQRQVTLIDDGNSASIVTNAATVRALLAQAHVTLGPHDQVSVPMNAVPTDGETITIDNVTSTTETKQVSVPYQVKKESDPSTFENTQTVVTQGVDGIDDVTYALRTVNGVKQAPKVISTKVVKQPVTEVVKVGTKPYPTTVAGAEGLDWAALAQCESGGNPKAVDPTGTYYGLYQFSVSTWESLGGTGLPSDASPSEQTYRAELDYVRSGAGQWPVCGAKLSE